MLPQNKPDRIRILFDDHRLVANAGLILPTTLALHLGLPQLLRKHLDLGGAPGRANTGRRYAVSVTSQLASPRPSTGGKWPDSFLTVTRKPSAKRSPVTTTAPVVGRLAKKKKASSRHDDWSWFDICTRCQRAYTRDPNRHRAPAGVSAASRCNCTRTSGRRPGYSSRIDTYMALQLVVSPDDFAG